MPLPETGERGAVLDATALLPAREELCGWGGGPKVASTLVAPDGVETLRTALARRQTPAIARGLGRAYGDAAQLAGGLVFDMTHFKGFTLQGDGVVSANAGVSIAELLQTLVPQGWMVPVVPGTQHVTVAGAVASDIHGKNHGVDGSFGAHVRGLSLLLGSGEEVELEPGDELFDATVGGMGLTGVITRVSIAMRPVSSAQLAVDTDRVAGLDDALALLSGPGGPYRVAWLDLLGPRPGRGVVTRAQFQDAAGDLKGATVAARAAVPERWPTGLLRPGTLRAFNELRFRSSPRSERGKPQPLGAHMFPLDALEQWPRLYGRRGFVQYQLVVPFGAERVLEQVIEGLKRSRVPCYLAVLKDFGPAGGPPLSFPIAGWTLALDLPRGASGLWPLLDQLDELVAQAGGRVYLSKDARLRPETVAAMYPRLQEWREIRDRADPDGVWASDLALRTGLVGTESPSQPVPPRAPRRAALNVLVVGGSSEIGVGIVRRLAADGPVRPYLLGRDRGRLEQAASELARAGTEPAQVATVDADDLATHGQAVAEAFESLRRVDVVVLAVGVLGAQQGLDADPEEALEIMRVNFVGAGSLMLESLRRLRSQATGTLVVLSSVAAERARASNAIYGAAKAGFDALAQGLADRCAVAGDGVRIVVVRPGFVHTRMTEGLEPVPFATTIEAVAEATVVALTGSAHTVWVPSTLRYVFAVLRHLPRWLYRRLPL
jgi:decaprenylphospho-beta-D-ribofuranose 2-oxidase